MSSVIDHYQQKMTEDDKVFFAALGRSITKLRKTQNMTQGQLAELLGISQQHMASFEKGIRKVPASMLPMLAQLFGISVDELVGLKSPAAKRGPVPKLQRQIELVTRLPKAKQKFVSEMLDTVIQQQQ
ncbi:MAG: helix-turn-helix domain-containing protein [Candidatus Thiodiazotropha sp. (ex Lucinoma kastoroae)]|nr:helix-turn-helix domain-containing protein [Candidatus Thiodiazotropha sp. (ex Lucinoma kastoroae)]